MFRKLILILIVVAACSSCSGPAGKQAGPMLLIPSTTFSRSIPGTVIRPTQTPFLSPIAEIATVIPTTNPTLVQIFNSTFDPKTVLTRTPALPQKCPTPNPGLKLFPIDPNEIMDNFSTFFQKVMDFLNAGGNPDLIRDHIVGSEPYLWAEEDLTGDGIPELVMSIYGVDILMCADGQYIAGLHLMTGADPFPGTVILAIKDMNLDGVPELVLRGSIMSAGVMIYSILEWNGTDFHSLIWSEQEIAPWFYTSIGQAMNWYTYWSDITLSADETIVSPSSTAAVRDTDGNGTLELLIHSDIPVPQYLYGGPYRETTETYQWNGFYFSLAQLDIDPPVYRFQAVEDADRLSLLGKYQQAMDYYQEVISSKKLAVWSQDNYHAQFLAENNGTPTPTFIPPNQDEYGNLAAYALYRIMLLQLLQNESGAVKITYNNLEKTYPQDQPGHLYAELATVFWEKYNVSQNMSEACSEAIRFAEDHKDNIYTYLGNAHDLANTHGGQSHNYSSWDLCPFK